MSGRVYVQSHEGCLFRTITHTLYDTRALSYLEDCGSQVVAELEGVEAGFDVWGALDLRLSLSSESSSDTRLIVWSGAGFELGECGSSFSKCC